MHGSENHNRSNLFVYVALLQMADCNHNTRANQTLSAESHAIPAYKSDSRLKYDSKIELYIF